MPVKNGLQAVQELQAYYEELNLSLARVKVKKPLFVMLTAFKTPSFLKYIQSKGIEDCYEKPLELEHLVKIFEKASD